MLQQGFDSGFAKVPCGQFQSQELERRRFWNWGGAPEREAPQSALAGVGGEAPGKFLVFWDPHDYKIATENDNLSRGIRLSDAYHD